MAASGKNRRNSANMFLFSAIICCHLFFQTCLAAPLNSAGNDTAPHVSQKGGDAAPVLTTGDSSDTNSPDLTKIKDSNPQDPASEPNSQNSGNSGNTSATTTAIMTTIKNTTTMNATAEAPEAVSSMNEESKTTVEGVEHNNTNHEAKENATVSPGKTTTTRSPVHADAENTTTAVLNDMTTTKATTPQNTTSSISEEELLDNKSLQVTVFDASDADDEEEPEDKPTEPTQVTDTTEEPEIDLTALPERNTDGNDLLSRVSSKQDYTEDEDDDEEDSDYYPMLRPGGNARPNVPSNKFVTRVEVVDTDEQNSHFFFHLVILVILVAIVYITYHNKRKIFLLAQSRRWRDGLCSRNTAGYHRLDTNVNEAMPSLKITRDYIF